MAPGRGLKNFLVLLTLLYPGLPLRAASGQGKTYVITGKGRHYTRTGRTLRKQKYSKAKFQLVQLKVGPGFVVANPGRAWGTKLVVYNLNKVMALYHHRFPDAAPVIMRDLSKRGGGPLDNHDSHMDGRDVDIPVILYHIDEPGSSSRNIDPARTWFLVKALADTCDVEYIFLDRGVQALIYQYALDHGIPARLLKRLLHYPSEGGEALVQHWPNHIDHLHVRFRFEKGALPPAARSYCKHED